MITDWHFYFFAIPAVLVAGLSKGGFGAGAAFAATPLMALAAPPQIAVGLLLPILCVMDVVGMRAYWKQWDWPNVRVLVSAALAGILLGWLTFRCFDDNILRLLIGVIALVFVVHSVVKNRIEIRPAPFSARRGVFWGTIAGFTSFTAHAGGPPAAVHLLPQRLHKTTYQATTVLIFWAINLAKIPPYIALGFFTREVLLTALVLLPLAPVGMYLGIWAHDKVSDIWFYRIAYILLTITGAKLVFDSAV